jgi:hypothetical protein
MTTFDAFARSIQGEDTDAPEARQTNLQQCPRQVCKYFDHLCAYTMPYSYCHQQWTTAQKFEAELGTGLSVRGSTVT